MQSAVPVPDTLKPSGRVVEDVWRAYRAKIPRQLQVVDAFLAYVLATGLIQFCYATLAGSFPFNSFLAGFLSCVGVFVLTVSLRMQLHPANRRHPAHRWHRLTPLRAYADWLFCNLILHLAVLNFIG